MCLSFSPYYCRYKYLSTALVWVCLSVHVIATLCVYISVHWKSAEGALHVHSSSSIVIVYHSLIFVHLFLSFFLLFLWTPLFTGEKLLSSIERLCVRSLQQQLRDKTDEEEVSFWLWQHSNERTSGWKNCRKNCNSMFTTSSNRITAKHFG